MEEITNQTTPAVRKNDVVDMELIKKDGAGLGLLFVVLGTLLFLAGIVFTSLVELILGLILVFAGWQTRRIQNDKQKESATANVQPSSPAHD